MIVRKINPIEIDSIVILAEYYRDHFEIDDFNADKMLDTIREYSIQLTHNWLVAFDNQRPVGFIAGNLNQLPWNEKLFAIVDLFFLIPSHDTIENRDVLYQAFEDWAINLTATNIKMISYAHHTKSMTDYFETKGFRDNIKISEKVI